MNVNLNLNYFLSLIILWYIKSMSIAQVYNRICNKYNVPRQSLRKLERNQFKFKKRNLHNQFLMNCQYLEVYPKCISSKKSNRHYINANNDSLNEVSLNALINENFKILKQLRRAVITDLSVFRERLSWFDYAVLITAISKFNTSNLFNTKTRHENKLKYLYFRKTLDRPRGFRNLSSHKLTTVQESILSQGLDGHILPPPLK